MGMGKVLGRRRYRLATDCQDQLKKTPLPKVGENAGGWLSGIQCWGSASVWCVFRSSFSLWSGCGSESDPAPHPLRASTALLVSLHGFRVRLHDSTVILHISLTFMQIGNCLFTMMIIQIRIRLPIRIRIHNTARISRICWRKSGQCSCEKHLCQKWDLANRAGGITWNVK